MKGESNAFSVIAIAAIGALLGQALKFLFADMLPNLLRFRRKFRDRLRTYLYRLYITVESLDRKLGALERVSAKEWSRKANDPYLREETLYLIASFFAWTYILEREALVDRFSKNYSVKLFNVLIYRPHSAVSSRRDLSTAERFNGELGETSAIPRAALTAIGEIMLSKDEKSGEYGIKTFLDFKNSLNRQPLKQWIHPFDKFIVGSLKSESRSESAQYNRFKLFRIHLRVLNKFLRSYEYPHNSLKDFDYDGLHPVLRIHMLKLYRKRLQVRFWLLRRFGQPGIVG